MENDRRHFLAASAALGLSTIISSGNVLADETVANKKSEDEEDISAPEDLMREHGVLNRILLIYEEGLRRLRAKQDVPPEVFHKPAALVRSFVEDYHEKLEEEFIFPAFEKQHKLFGEDGFEKAVDEVAAIEKQLGIYDLANFTPK
jgi:hypothetical protein